MRNTAIAHVDQDSGTAELRNHVDPLTPEKVEPVADAFVALVAAVRQLPIGRYYSVPGPNERIVMTPLQMDLPPPKRKRGT